MTKETVTDALLSAVESCEALLQYAREAHAAFRDGEYELAWQILGKAKGYGFFDDDYHRNMIRQFIRMTCATLYYVADVGNAWVVRKTEDSDTCPTLAWFSKDLHPRAKEAAIAERDRLNALYRKEQV